MNNDFQKVIVGFILLIVCIIFPFLLIVIVPAGLYYMTKESNEKQKVNEFLEQQFKGKSHIELEEIRINYLNMANNPLSTEAEKANAKYIVKFIEEKKYKN